MTEFYLKVEKSGKQSQESFERAAQYLETLLRSDEYAPWGQVKVVVDERGQEDDRYHRYYAVEVETGGNKSVIKYAANYYPADKQTQLKWALAIVKQLSQADIDDKRIIYFPDDYENDEL